MASHLILFAHFVLGITLHFVDLVVRCLVDFFFDRMSLRCPEVGLAS